ncbi:hypothetical protein BH09BAC5_BH09BAC5_14160 [soil metagenome]
MNNILNFLLLLILVSSCNPNTKVSGTTITDIYSPPKDSIISLSYQITNERNAYKLDEHNSSKKYLSESNGYDSKMNNVEHIRYSSHGDIEEQIVFIYQLGKIKEEYRLEKGNNESLYKTNYHYLEDGKLSSKITFIYEKGMKPGLERGYGKSGGCVVQQFDFKNRKSWRKGFIEEITYDKKDNIIEIRTTSGDSNVEREIYIYDENDNTIEESSYRGDELIRKITTTYFTDSVETKSIFPGIGEYEGNEGKVRYDKNKNIIDEQGIDKPSGKLFYRRINTYDSENRIIKEEYITNIGVSIFTHYEYKIYKSPLKKTFVVDNK